MILSYPKQNDPHVQEKISNLFELYQYSRALRDTGNAPEYISDLKPFEHQEILKILSKTWKRFFVVNATGTGKACLMIKAAEDLIRVTNGKYPKRVIVLFQGPLTVSDYKHQIAWVCTKGKYAIPGMSKRQISDNISEKYQVTTYRKFYDEINSPNAHENFDDCMFIFEEVHNLRNLVRNDPEINNTIYSRLHSFIHKVKSPIVACVTASPMINETKEIAPIMNLLLPLSRQLPLDWNYDLVTKEQFEPFMRGLITYVPEIRGEIREIEMGESINTDVQIKVPIRGEPIVAGNKQKTPETEIISFKSTSKLFIVDLKGLQKEVFLKEKNRLGEEFTKWFMAVPIPISLMVFPDGSYSSDMSKGLGKYISNPYGDIYIPKPEFLTDLRKNLWQYSAKYHHIVESELNAPTTITYSGVTVSLPGPSLSFVISPRVSGPGAIALAMCLEAFGFERYDSNFSPFVDPNAPEKGYPGRLLNISKKKRYILLAGDVSGKIDNMRNLFNSPENMFGEYVQVIIASEVAKEGINIYNTLRAYSATQSWHHAGEYQFFSRVLRATSQKNLYNEIIKRFVNAGLGYDQLKDFKLDIIIKKLVARVDGVSLEANTYVEFVEEKRFHTGRVFQIMKELAYDRYLIGIDGDRLLTPDQLSYNNFILSEQFDNAKNLIYKKLGNIYSTYSKGFTVREAMGYLYRRLTPYLLKKEFIVTTLIWIVKSEKILLNKSGVEVYTKIDKDNPDRFIPVRLWIRDIYIDRGILWYNENISFNCLSTENSINGILSREKGRRFRDATNDFIYYVYQDRDLNFVVQEDNDEEIPAEEYDDPIFTLFKWFENLDRLYQSFLVEYSLQNINSFQKREDFKREYFFASYILAHSRERYIFKLREPISNINLISQVLGQPKVSRGRKSLEDSDVKMKNVKLIPGEETDPRAQELYVNISRHTGFVIKKDDDIRVFKENKWRKIDPYEIYAYKNHVNEIFRSQYMNATYQAAKKSNSIWGISRLDGSFTIMLEPYNVNIDDLRFASKGINCDSKSRKDLEKIYKQMGGDLDLSKFPKETICRILLAFMNKLDVLAFV